MWNHCKREYLAVGFWEIDLPKKNLKSINSYLWGWAGFDLEIFIIKQRRSHKPAPTIPTVICGVGRVLIWKFLLLGKGDPIKRRFYVTGFPRDVKKRQDTSPYNPVCGILVGVESPTSQGTVGVGLCK
jgi:hypothetical protein